MNKRGQAMLFGLMVVIIVFIVTVVLADSVKSVTDEGRSNLGCGDDNITAGTSLTCIGLDLFLPFLTLTVIFAALGLISKFAGA